MRVLWNVKREKHEVQYDHPSTTTLLNRAADYTQYAYSIVNVGVCSQLPQESTAQYKCSFDSALYSVAS